MRFLLLFSILLCALCVFALTFSPVFSVSPLTAHDTSEHSRSYLGFDRNMYPGDSSLPSWNNYFSGHRGRRSPPRHLSRLSPRLDGRTQACELYSWRLLLRYSCEGRTRSLHHDRGRHQQSRAFPRNRDLGLQRCLPSVAWLRISSKPSSTFGERHLLCCGLAICAIAEAKKTHRALPREVRARWQLLRAW